MINCVKRDTLANTVWYVKETSMLQLLQRASILFGENIFAFSSTSGQACSFYLYYEIVLYLWDQDA